jgi:hypothetical protein
VMRFLRTGWLTLPLLASLVSLAGCAGQPQAPLAPVAEVFASTDAQEALASGLDWIVSRTNTIPTVPLRAPKAVPLRAPRRHSRKSPLRAASASTQIAATKGVVK